MTPLPVEPAHRLVDRPDDQRWLVTGLWAEEAVGIIGGEPKCCKSFLALDLAVAVAAGTPCLRRFAATLARADQPQPFADLRAACRVRTATLYQHLAAMTATSRIVKSPEGYRPAR